MSLRAFPGRVDLLPSIFTHSVSYLPGLATVPEPEPETRNHVQTSQTLNPKESSLAEDAFSGSLSQ